MDTAAFIRAIRPLLMLIAVIWTIELINQMIGHRLSYWFGVEPRHLTGLVGVPIMPLLHFGLEHVAANTVPLGVLGTIGLLVAPAGFWRASFFIVIASGLGVWFLARDGIIVGASGLIFGWFGFLVAYGVMERSARAIAGATVVIILYGGTLWRVLPQQDITVSWEAHFLGTLSGAIAAAYIHERLKVL